MTEVTEVTEKKEVMEKTDETDKKIVEVVVGVVMSEGRVLLNARPEGKPYAGWWEFPGGKIEPGESAHEALVREFREELGIELEASRAWFVTEAVYPHAHVRLHFRVAEAVRGTPQSLEHQAWGWFAEGESTPGEVLPASVPVLRRVWLPRVMRGADARWKGVVARTRDDLLTAAEAGADYARVAAADWTIVGEPPLPVYAEGVAEEALEAWCAQGAHGIFIGG